MAVDCIYTGRNAIRVPGEAESVTPFEPFEAPDPWLAQNGRSHRIKTLEDYDQMLDGMDENELRTHLKARREQTDESLDARGSAETLRDQMYFTRDDEGE